MLSLVKKAVVVVVAVTSFTPSSALSVFIPPSADLRPWYKKPADLMNRPAGVFMLLSCDVLLLLLNFSQHFFRFANQVERSGYAYEVFSADGVDSDSHSVGQVRSDLRLPA